MDVLIDYAGDNGATLKVDDFGAGVIKIDVLGDVDDFVVADQDIGPAQRLRSKDIAIFQQAKHRISPFVGKWIFSYFIV